MSTTAPKKTAARRKSSTETATATDIDAIELLTTDHQDVQALFDAYQELVEGEADGDERAQLAGEICTKLTVHATIEEELFYPAVREVLDDDQDLLDEAEVEHACAKDLIAQISGSDPDDELFDAKVKVLGEYVAHHVEEEEGELFPKVRESGLDLNGLGEEMADRKIELMAELENPTE